MSDEARSAVDHGLGDSPQRVAEAVRDRMLATDRATRTCGIEVIDIGPGTATLRMTVRADMLNGFDTCHGGFLTVLADSAFAFACNTANVQAVDAGIAMELLAPAREGDVLTARAMEVVTAGRNGHYDVQLHDQRGDCVAVFRGRSHRFVGRPVVQDVERAGADAPVGS